MTASDLVRDLRKRGVRIELAGARARCAGPKAVLTAQILQLLVAAAPTASAAPALKSRRPGQRLDRPPSDSCRDAMMGDVMNGDVEHDHLVKVMAHLEGLRKNRNGGAA